MCDLLRVWIASSRRLQIGIFGLDSAGKTTIFNHIRRGFSIRSGDVLPRTQATDEFDARNVKLHKMSVLMWDMGGQEVFRARWANWLIQRDALVYVIDMNDVGRFHESMRELKRLLVSVNRMGSSPTDMRFLVCGLPVLVLLNKMDLYQTQFAINPTSFLVPEIDIRGDAVRESQQYFDEGYAKRVLDIIFRQTNALRVDARDHNVHKVFSCSALSSEGLIPPTEWLDNELYQRTSWF